MKHSERHKDNKDSHLLPQLLLWGVPLVLSIPAAGLSVFGQMSAVETMAHILLPTGLLLLLLSCFVTVGATVLWLVPLMVLAAFQIVLLFLYGDGSIIGVDMFLNVATTNSSEALELLDNLLPAILTVIALYLPAIVCAIVILRRHWTVPRSSRIAARYTAVALSAAGAVSLLYCLIAKPHYRVDEDFYPANVICNLGSALHRGRAAKMYGDLSAGYRFDAKRTRTEGEREVYIAVIGETSRADNWQLFGYDRFTTPYLCNMPDSTLAAYGLTLSESNTTHKSVPLLLSALTSEGFDEEINTTKSVITAFKEAGFQTGFVSMQARNHGYIDFFASEADTVMFMREPTVGMIDVTVRDVDLLPVVDSLLQSGADRQLIVLHLYGSHFNYYDRYPREDAYFLPDLTKEAKAANRGRLINAYDNTIRQTDMILSALIERLDSMGCPGGLIYTSDHGEDIFDDERCRFLHASPTPTFMQLHVPFLVHLTPALRAEQPELWVAAKANEHQRVSSSASYTPTLMQMAGIASPRVDEHLSLLSGSYRPEAEPLFLNDRNRAETLEEAGFRHGDFERLRNLKTKFIAEKFPEFRK